MCPKADWSIRVGKQSDVVMFHSWNQSVSSNIFRQRKTGFLEQINFINIFFIVFVSFETKQLFVCFFFFYLGESLISRPILICVWLSLGFFFLRSAFPTCSEPREDLFCTVSFAKSQLRFTDTPFGCRLHYSRRMWIFNQNLFFFFYFELAYISTHMSESRISNCAHPLRLWQSTRFFRWVNSWCADRGRRYCVRHLNAEN